MHVKLLILFALFLFLLSNGGQQVLQTCQMPAASLKLLASKLEPRANIRFQDYHCDIAQY